MSVLPSLLEYSPQQLSTKLSLLEHPKVADLTRQGDTLQLHIDYVGEFFAKQRSILSSLSLKTTLAIITNKYANQKLQLTIHLMGELEDIILLEKFFRSYTIQDNWAYVIFVPPKFISTFSFMRGANVEIGVWYDLQEWQSPTDKHTPYLLMTVRAGISGQKLRKQTQHQAIEWVNKYPNYFVVDGGWSITHPDINSHTDIVSHSSFWNTLGS